MMSVCGLWNESSIQFHDECVNTLWNAEYPDMLQELRSLGLSDQTIRSARIGYNGIERYELNGGIISSGHIIPWFLNGKLEGLTSAFVAHQWELHDKRERLRAYTTDSLLNRTVLFYGMDAIDPDRPVLLTGHPFEALAVRQVCQGALVPLAISSHFDKRLWPDFEKALAVVPMVYVCLDDHMADMWLPDLPNMIYLSYPSQAKTLVDVADEVLSLIGSAPALINVEEGRDSHVLQ